MTKTRTAEPVPVRGESPIAFSKLEALGNDFVLVDARERNFEPDTDTIRRWADRHRGIGFDQLLVLRNAASDAYCHVDIHNADGSAAEQCGNGMRAVALWLRRYDDAGGPRRLSTEAGAVDVNYRNDDEISATLGIPQLVPAAVGLEGPEAFPWQLEVEGEALSVFGASLGNPHLLIVEEQPPPARRLAAIGAALGSHQALAGGANVGFATIKDDHRIDLRVFERGAGPTEACGSGAAAAAVILIARERVKSPVEVSQPGGSLVVNWSSEHQPVSTAGPARHVFEGVIQWPTHPN